MRLRRRPVPLANVGLPLTTSKLIRHHAFAAALTHAELKEEGMTSNGRAHGIARRGQPLEAVLRDAAFRSDNGKQPDRERMTALTAEGKLPAAARERSPGEVVAVYSPKGGVGTSFLASRLALAAAVRCGRRVALGDLDPSRGDAPTLVGVRVQRSFLELLGDDPPEIGDLAASHASGLDVFAPLPLDPAAGLVDGGAVERLFALLRAAYDVAVVDVPATIDEATVAALAAADRAFLVTVPEETCVQRARRLVRALRSHNVPLARVAVLHNMDTKLAGADAALIVAELDLPLAGVMPFDPVAIWAAINSDADPADRLGDDPVTAAVVDLALRLWPAASGPAESASIRQSSTPAPRRRRPS
jgi:pilus assembly protein CpaE